jgi:hypothetical protein
VDYFEKVRTYVGFCDVVLLLVEGDDKSDTIDGGRGIFFNLRSGASLQKRTACMKI